MEPLLHLRSYHPCATQLVPIGSPSLLPSLVVAILALTMAEETLVDVVVFLSVLVIVVWRVPGFGTIRILVVVETYDSSSAYHISQPGQGRERR